jgi:hypothetical protein
MLPSRMLPEATCWTPCIGICRCFLQDSTAAEGAAQGAEGVDDLATIPLTGGTPAVSPSAASADSGDDWTMIEVRLARNANHNKVHYMNFWPVDLGCQVPAASWFTHFQHACRRRSNALVQPDAG